uniref:Proline-rich transmembrane protein 3/4 domain-containing protein n=1 Tax=Monopterus albus TaxID=43700 RepID=A0A3Q3KKR3_MONAL
MFTYPQCFIHSCFFYCIVFTQSLFVSTEAQKDGVTDTETGIGTSPSLTDADYGWGAAKPLFFLGFLLFVFHSSDAQTIIDSSFSINSSPPTTKQTAQFSPSLPPRGRSDVPIRPTIRDRLTNTVQQGKRKTRPTPQAAPSFISALPTQNLSSGPILTQPTASRPRTDTASLAFSRAFAKGDTTTKGSTPPQPTLPSSVVAEPASSKPVTAKNTVVGSVKTTEDADSQGLGSGSVPVVMLVNGDSPVPLPTVGDEMAQYRPQAQTSILDVKTPPQGSHVEKPHHSVLPVANNISMTPQTQTRATVSHVVTQATPRIVLTGTSSFLTTGVVPANRTRYGPTYQTGIGQRNRSILLGHPHQAPYSTSNPAPSPSINSSPNGTLLDWGDLSHTLAFAWELHVYGSASLFLLLFAGAALGLTLSPNTNCPHRGALTLANGLLLLSGGLRAAFFLIDPYGTRKFLPRPAVTALYNLPLHLLVWTQAALALLALRVAEVCVLPPTMERPPLVAVLAVLQCTLLLAADLLSPALSAVVPVTLQVLSLCWGLALCLGFLCHARRKAWTGSRRTGVILGRVLAVCAVLGALCCGLHIHATLWLYGLLGDWTHFNWGWWLVHFWARLLELAWGFFLLLLGSWVFWRPQGCQGREEGGPDGEVPNNWAGQDRPGADISKSLIRNQNHEAHPAEQGVSDGSTSSLLRLQTLGRPLRHSVSGSLDHDKDTSLSFYEFDLRPPSPIDLTRSIDEALHREHLLGGGSLFHPLNQTLLSPSPSCGVNQGPWLRRNSDPQLLSESSEALTESSMPLGGSILSSVPSRQVTAPPTPSHQGHRFAGDGLGNVPSSVSCPVSLHPSRTSTEHLGEDGVDDTRPFITPDSERVRGRAGRPVGSRSYLEVSRHDDSASVSSEIIDL